MPNKSGIAKRSAKIRKIGENSRLPHPPSGHPLPQEREEQMNAMIYTQTNIEFIFLNSETLKL
jgi:hypothetical protein